MPRSHQSSSQAACAKCLPILSFQTKFMDVCSFLGPRPTVAPLAFSRFMLAVIPPHHRQAGSEVFHSHQSWRAVESGMPGMIHSWYFLIILELLCSYSVCPRVWGWRGKRANLWMRLLWLPGRVWRCQDSPTCTFVLKLLLNILCPLWLTAFACHYGYLKLSKSLLMIPASCWWCLHTGTIILRQKEAGQDSNS